jgi:hypothetical protein
LNGSQLLDRRFHDSGNLPKEIEPVQRTYRASMEDYTLRPDRLDRQLDQGFTGLEERLDTTRFQSGHKPSLIPGDQMI